MRVALFTDLCKALIMGCGGLRHAPLFISPIFILQIMEELIKEAERLYKQIDEIQLDLIKSRLDESEGQKAKATDEMETVMCEVFQFLKFIIDRKDNIVDLGEVWKDGNKEKPIPYSPIVVKDCCIVSGNDDDVDDSQWAYLEDLLPKGGD